MNGAPWHGSSVAALLERLDAATAVARPPGGTHSVWELVLHMTGWAREVTARLDGRPAREPVDGDWPSVGDPSPARWAAACADLFTVHARLAEAIRQIPEATLEAPVRDDRDGAMGTGLSRYVTVHGLVHHTVYHAGQIAVVTRLVR